MVIICLDGSVCLCPLESETDREHNLDCGHVCELYLLSDGGLQQELYYCPVAGRGTRIQTLEFFNK